MRLLVGLGNPGQRYAGNRHNIGFMIVDTIARRHGASPWRRRFHGLVAEGQVGGERILLLKPETYMNDSGRAVSEAAQFYKLEPADLVVFHDEIDLPPGKVRVKAGGGTAGHNGLRSVAAHIGNEFRRVRIGVGHPGLRDLVQHYVLQNFAKAEQGWVEALCATIAENVGLLVRGHESTFQNKVHLVMQAKGFFDQEERKAEAKPPESA